MKYNKNCAFCSCPFTTNREKQIYCSEKCNRLKSIERNGRYSMNKDIPAGSVGAISEMVSGAFFLEKGYDVFRSISPACYCDLIVSKGDKKYAVEVRTAYVSESGKLTFGKNKKERKSPDLFCLYDRNNQKVIVLNNNLQKVNI